MIVKIIEVIEVTDYDPPSPSGAVSTMPTRKYFLRDGTPLVVPTPSPPVSGFTITMDPCDPNIYPTGH
jgi:hypothetical protein